VVDSFTCTYTRDFQAHNDLLEFSFEPPSRFAVSGFTTDDIFMFDITSPAEVYKLINAEITGVPGSYQADFEPSAGTGTRRYALLASAAWKSPTEIIEDTHRSDIVAGADYILITEKSLGWDGLVRRAWLTDLIALRSTEMAVAVMDVEDIFDAFSYGISTPQAITAFLTDAYTNWTPTPRYVLLVGDSSYDYRTATVSVPALPYPLP